MPKKDVRLARRGAKSWRLLSATVAACSAVFAAVGCSDGYDIAPLPAGQMLLGDMDCQANNEPSAGDPCTQDCLTATCGPDAKGSRVCTCEGGIFLQCQCLPPPIWPYTGVPTAPYCDHVSGQPRYLAGDTCTDGDECRSGDFPDQGCHCIKRQWSCAGSSDVSASAPICETVGKGYQASMKGKPCDTEWDLCIARDYNPSGTSPRGCICMRKGMNPKPEWICGSTNRWFRAE